ncbi:MAG: hypothetical protein ACR2N9_05010 [Acidimicrobiia bacterium]
MTRRLALLWVVLAAAGGLTATGRLEAAPADAPRIGTARVAFNDAAVESAQYGTGVDLVASYPVSADELVGDEPVDAVHAELWATVVATVPDQWRQGIRQFSVVQEKPAGTVAMVHQSGLDPRRWLLSIDLADADNPRLVRETLIHEMAHLITLGTDEFTFNHRLTGPCDGVIVEIGCAHADSVLARWAEAFWVDPQRPTDYDQAGFVAPYAATGPHEDLAETFLYWARGDRAGDLSGAGFVLDAKFAFIERELGDLTGVVPAA